MILTHWRKYCNLNQLGSSVPLLCPIKMSMNSSIEKGLDRFWSSLYASHFVLQLLYLKTSIFWFSNIHSVFSGKIIIISHSKTACDLKTNVLHSTTFHQKYPPSFPLVWPKSYHFFLQSEAQRSPLLTKYSSRATANTGQGNLIYWRFFCLFIRYFQEGIFYYPFRQASTNLAGRDRKKKNG